MASKRNYLSQSELAEFADITITDTTEADDRITQAEELLDSFVGFQNKAVSETFEGMATGGSTTTLTLETRHQNIYQQDYFIYCMVEIIGGTGIGQRSRITASTLAGVITFDTLTTAPDSTSIYRIWQLGKFPRPQDEYYDSIHTPSRYYRSIPEAVKRATAAQVEYMIQMGDAYFSTDKAEMESESIGDYSYDKDGSLSSMIAPKAKMLLRGIKNIKGEILV
jgi:hypothetical protein